MPTTTKRIDGEAVAIAVAVLLAKRRHFELHPCPCGQWNITAAPDAMELARGALAVEGLTDAISL